MSTAAPQLHISTAPFLHRGLSTQRVMFEVLLALVPVLIAATYYFGVSALLLVSVSTAGAVLAEWLLKSDRRSLGPLRDYTAVLTGVLLGLTLPPSLPLWMGFVGGVVAISLGKLIFGGLGQNMFNPALVGRAFLQAAFPSVMTTWTRPESLTSIEPSTWAAPMLHSSADVVTTATPLALSKFDHQVTDAMPLLIGDTGGSLGETAGIILLLCGLYLGARRIFDWRLAVSPVLTVAVFAGILHAMNPGAYPPAEFMVLSGGLLFGAVFMCTDPVTTPITPRGAWIFGVGVGILVVLIRLFGGLPEGVMFAILLMNGATPLINKYTQPRPFGG